MKCHAICFLDNKVHFHYMLTEFELLQFLYMHDVHDRLDLVRVWLNDTSLSNSFSLTDQIVLIRGA